jgi:bis(5'-nucleosidyl)-tetraphosphatase
MKEDIAYGVIVFYIENDGNLNCEIQFLILKQIQGHWSFPKGHADKGESKLETALRELEEESGIKDVELISDLPQILDEYTIKPGTPEETHKVVEFYIGRVKNKDVEMQKGEIFDHKWITNETGNEVFTFDSSRRILKAAYSIVKEYLKTKS